MNKRSSIIKLSLIAGALLIAVVFTFLQIGGINGYRGVMGTIEARMGAEAQDGVVLVYRAQQTENSSKVPYARQLDARMTIMRMNLWSEQGKNNGLINNSSDISRQGFDKIRIESTRTTISSDVSERAEKAVDIIFADGADREIAPGSVIQNVRLYTRLSSYVLEIEISKEGQDALNERSIDTISIIDRVAKEAGGEESSYLIGKLPEGAFSEGKLVSNKITFTEFTSNDDMYMKYYKLISGSRPLTLTLVSIDTVNGNSAHTRAILALVAGIAAAVLLSAFLIIRYKGLGIMAAASLLACFTVLLFFAAVLPFSTLSFTALGMITLMMFLNAGSYVLAFEGIREEYAKGKTVQASAAAGFKKTFWPLFDIHLFALIAGAGLWILGAGALSSAGMIVLFASVLSFAATQLCRYLTGLTMSVYGDDINPSLFSLKNAAKDEVAK